MKLNYLKIPSHDQKYYNYRNLDTLKDLMTYQRLDSDIEKYKSKGTYTYLFNIVESLKKDNANQIRKASYKLFLYLKHDVIRLARHQNEDNINQSIKEEYGIFLPNVVRYFLKKSLAEYYIIDCGIVENQHEFIGTVIGYIETFPNKEYQDLLREYVLKGRTTREIATKTNVSFQAISDKLKKILPTNELLLEIQYIPLIKYMRISEKEFYKIFPNESKQTFIILSNLVKRGKNNTKKITDIIEDNNISYSIRKQVFSYYQNENTFKLNNGDIITLQSDSIIKYIVVKFFSSSIFSSEDIFKKYQEIIQEIKENSEKSKRYYINQHSFKTLLLKNSFVLPTKNNRYRYENIDELDKEKIIEECELFNYKNIEISSRLIYEKKKELFDSLRIKNHYELYFFLKKTIDSQKYNIVFKKAPHLIFGNGDLKQQIKQIKKENPNILPKEFVTLLEKRYGISPRTAYANYLKENGT